MNLKGTKFQLKVWNYLKKIPKGKVKTYLEVAKAIGKPKAFRAVANAVGKNPYPPKIPCHRVIRSDGSLGGILWKRWNSTKTTFIEIRKGLYKIVLLIPKNDQKPLVLNTFYHLAIFLSNCFNASFSCTANGLSAKIGYPMDV